MRSHSRSNNQLRPIKIKRNFTKGAPGSVLISAGRTQVICTASFETGVPRWRKGSGLGWLTAEYSMLPGCGQPRKGRERTKVGGRTAEIQRLIGRSLRAVTDLERLGENTIWIDCDVIEADGGTRTASITGAFVALIDAIQKSQPELLKTPCVLRDSIAAVSIGIVEKKTLLDLDYSEDVNAEVDLNLVVTGEGRFVEVQGTGEESTFTRNQLDDMLKVGVKGVQELKAAQQGALKRLWPFK